MQLPQSNVAQRKPAGVGEPAAQDGAAGRPDGRALEFNPAILKAGGAALSACHVAILCDFIPASPSAVAPSFKNPGMEKLGYTYPPLAEIVKNVSQLAAYKKWLMLCCRSKIENIITGASRPEQYPERVRPFTE